MPPELDGVEFWSSASVGFSTVFFVFLDIADFLRDFRPRVMGDLGAAVSLVDVSLGTHLGAATVSSVSSAVRDGVFIC